MRRSRLSIIAPHATGLRAEANMTQYLRRTMPAASAPPQRLHIFACGGSAIAPGGRTPGGQGAPRLSGCPPFRNRHQSDPVIQDRLAGRCRWETQRWRLSRCALSATPASAPASPSDNGSPADGSLKAPSLPLSSTVDVFRCSAPQGR